MAKHEQGKAQRPGQQSQESRQSGGQGGSTSQTGKAGANDKTRAGIGSSQGQDRGSPREQQDPRPSAGTPDIERGGGGGDIERQLSSRDSLVNDPTGAFKERP